MILALIFLQSTLKRDTFMIKDVNLNSFGARLLYFRKHILKMKRIDFVSTLELPLISIQSWETEKTAPSKRSLLIIEAALDKHKIPYSKKWLFKGEGSPLDFDSRPGDEFGLDNFEKLKIETAHFEPIIPKSCQLLLKYLALEDLKIPSIILMKDASSIFHIGIATETYDGTFILQAYRSNFYSIKIDNSFTLFKIYGVLPAI